MGWRGNARPGSWLPVLSLSLLTRSSSSETRTVKVSSLCWTKAMWVISFCLMWDFLSAYCPSVCLSVLLSPPLPSVLSTWSTWRSFGRLRPGTDCGASIRLWARTPTACPTWTRYTAQERNILLIDEAKDFLSFLSFFQDLPNNMIHQVAIKSLPQEWLWCETWCDDASKARAKTIDLVSHRRPARSHLFPGQHSGAVVITDGSGLVVGAQILTVVA